VAEVSREKLKMQIYSIIRFNVIFFAIIALAVPARAVTLYAFKGGNDGSKPDRSGVVVGAGGVLYGTTATGGLSNLGTVFALAPPAVKGGSWVETLIHIFQGSDGANPQGGLVMAKNGVLYGTTSAGGISSSLNPAGNGTVFSLTPPASAGGSWTFNQLYAFQGGTDGISPFSGLTLGPSGVLYGTTLGGGAFSVSSGGLGTVFGLSPPQAGGQQWAEALIYSFTGGSDGHSPTTALVLGRTGSLFGVSTDVQTPTPRIFELTPPVSSGGIWQFSVIHSFTANQGISGSELTIAPSGELVGTMSAGPSGPGFEGFVFTLVQGSPGGEWKETVVYAFPNAPAANVPLAPVVIGKGGVLYGTSVGGGQYSSGTVYELIPPTSPGGSWTQTILHAFRFNSDGFSPRAPVTIGASGFLYGTTSALNEAGTTMLGTVFAVAE